MSEAATIFDVFDAGRVLRWHTNPTLGGSQDFLDGHQGRVARYLLFLHPQPSRRLLRFALIHDDGERATGDLPPTAKRALSPSARLEVKNLEDLEIRRIWKTADDLDDDERAWLKFCDYLDRAIWRVRCSRFSENFQPTIRKLHASAVRLPGDNSAALSAVRALFGVCYRLPPPHEVEELFSRLEKANGV